MNEAQQKFIELIKTIISDKIIDTTFSYDNLEKMFDEMKDINEIRYNKI